MLLSRIQRDLFDFTDNDPDDFAGLVEFWYQSNSEALSAALTTHPGFNIIVNVSDFQNFEFLSKRLFLLADTLIIRDKRTLYSEKAEYRDIAMPVSDYRPGYFGEVIDQLKLLKPSPMTFLKRPTLYWTSTQKRLNNGYMAQYVGGAWDLIPAEFIAWISGSGRPYMETGSVVYAPFIPPIEMELEFFREGISLPDYFGAVPFFHQTHDWLHEKQLQALLSLTVPFLDGLDIKTLSKVKAEHRDEFSAFSRSLLDSVTSIKSSFGTEGFASEVRYIQRNLIDAALSDVEKTIAKIERSQYLRKAGLLAGLVGLNGAALLGAPEAAIATGIGATTAAMIAEKISQLKEQNDMRERKGYFLWKIQQSSKKN